jgi:hypothetical protein
LACLRRVRINVGVAEISISVLTSRGRVTISSANRFFATTRDIESKVLSRRFVRTPFQGAGSNRKNKPNKRRSRARARDVRRSRSGVCLPLYLDIGLAMHHCQERGFHSRSDAP